MIKLYNKKKIGDFVFKEIVGIFFSFDGDYSNIKIKYNEASKYYDVTVSTKNGGMTMWCDEVEEQ